MTPNQVSLIVSMLSAGTILGALVSAPLGDRFGRRRSLIGAIGIFCFGAIFQVCAADIPLLLVGRYVDACAFMVSSVSGTRLASMIRLD